MTGTEHGRRKFYGRQHGKTLRASQQRLLAEVLPRVAVPGVTRPDAPVRPPVSPEALFGARPVWLEIGFGGGEHLAHMAELHPEIGFIGCEPFVNGTAMLLARIEAQGLANVRVHAGDARDLLDLLPEGCLGRVFLLYPDPWPKTRHSGRRFANPENLRALARVMALGAELRLATDIAAYAAHALRAAAEVPEFMAEGDPASRGPPWPDWRMTRYEQKALRAGRAPQYLTFRRL